MRAYQSILGLAIRSTLARMVGIFLLLAVADVGLLLWGLHDMAGGYPTTFYNLYDGGDMMVFSLAAVALTWVLSTSCTAQKGGMVGYTTARLSIPQQRIALLWSVYYTLCFVLLFLVQFLVMLAMAYCYNRAIPPELVNHQSVLWYFYQSEFLHAIMPLGDIWLWVRNALIVVSTGLLCAMANYRSWQGKKLGVVIFAFFVSFQPSMFPTKGVELQEGMLMCAMVGLIIFALYTLLNPNREEEEPWENTLTD